MFLPSVSRRVLAMSSPKPKLSPNLCTRMRLPSGVTRYLWKSIFSEALNQSWMVDLFLARWVLTSGAF